ncbi:MAG: metalloregulator ArsR/SmtB family transcription factor [Actinomycetota bacterium]|nr:metalloregulator ArsR/SmtB family transcription factor [Actinomycetota bacterium]
MIRRELARQGSPPSGVLGRVVGRFLNRETALTNRHAISALDPQPNETILEIGFGGGATLGRLLHGSQVKLVGVELSETMVSEARRHFRDEIESGILEVSAGDVSALPFEEAAFDRVLTVHSVKLADDVAEQVKALADPTRLALAAALLEGEELCVCDLSWVMERADNLVSHHVRVLRTAGLATSRREGKMVLYSLTARGRALLEAALASEVTA